MKKCPYCAEEIQDDAIKCRFCGEYLKKKKKWINCLLAPLIGCLIFGCSMILLMCLSFMMIKFIIYRIFFAGPQLPHYYPPFAGQGVEGLVREFMELFRALWERLFEFLRFGAQSQSVTF